MSQRMSRIGGYGLGVVWSLACLATCCWASEQEFSRASWQAPPAGTAQACAPTEGADCCAEIACGWYGMTEALGWTRENRTSRVAVIEVTDEGTPTPGTTVLTTGDATFGWQPGVRAIVGWRQDRQLAWEAAYFGIFNWHAQAQALGNNNLAIPGDLGLASLDFFAADSLTLRYQSRLHSAEIHQVHSESDGPWSWLVGFRYLTLNEDFTMRAVDLDTGASHYRIHSTNNLFGGQFGVRYLEQWDAWGMDATAKAGLYGNAAQQRQSVTDFPPNFVLRPRQEGSEGQIAFVGELQFSIFYQLSDVWAIRAGYNLLWIEGVALAPDQLDFTDTTASGRDVRSMGGLFAHGVSAGVSAWW